MCSISLWKADLDFRKWSHTTLQRGGSSISPDPTERGAARLQPKELHSDCASLWSELPGGPWRLISSVSVHQKSPSVSVAAPGCHWRNLLHDTVKRGVSQHCHCSKYLLMYRNYLSPAFTSVPPVSATAFTWRYVPSVDQVQWLQ